MAFNYGVVTTVKSKIEQNTEELTSLFAEFSNLLDSQVNNSRVWNSESSQAFKKSWDEFEDVKFPQFKQHFRQEINNVTTSLAAYQRAEE